MAAKETKSKDGAKPLQIAVRKRADGTLELYALSDLPNVRPALMEVGDDDRETGRVLRTADTLTLTLEPSFVEGSIIKPDEASGEDADILSAKVARANDVASKRRELSNRRKFRQRK